MENTHEASFYLYGAENTHEASFYLYGADEGDRTLVPSLGSSYSTTELHPHAVLLA